MNSYQEAYEKLLDHFEDPGSWWPAETPFEIVVGAVLVQNTNWKNVEKALANLRDASLLDYDALKEITKEELAEYIRPAGFYNVKATRLTNLFHMLEENYRGDLDALLQDETWTARDALIEVKGIGAESADAILLYAGNHPLFVVDAYTHRVFSRHNLVDEETDYQSIQETFMANVEEDVAVFRAYHGLIIEVAKKYCKKSNPLCEACPLRGLNECEGGL